MTLFFWYKVFFLCMKSQGHNKKAAKALNRMHKAKITELNLIPNSIHDNNKHHVCMARRGLQILRYSSSYMYFNGDLTSIEYKCLICWIRFLIFKSCFSLPLQVTLNPLSGYSLRYSNDISLTGTMCPQLRWIRICQAWIVSVITEVHNRIYLLDSPRFRSLTVNFWIYFMF